MKSNIFNPELFINLEKIARIVLSEYDTFFDWKITDKKITQNQRYFLLMKKALTKSYDGFNSISFIVDINRNSVIDKVREEFNDITDEIAIRNFIISIIEQEIYHLTYNFQRKVANLVNEIPVKVLHSQEEWDFMKKTHEEEMNILRKELLKMKEFEK